MLKVRLTRVGRKNQAMYRVVVAEHTAPIQGKFVEIVGHYNPAIKEVKLDKEKIKKWLDNGAKPSNTVAKLLEKEGMKHKAIVIKKFKKSPKKKGDEAEEPKTEEKPQENTPETPAVEKKEENKE